MGHMNLAFHWDVVYSSQLFIKYALLQPSLRTAMGKLAEGISAYSYLEVKA